MFKPHETPELQGTEMLAEGKDGDRTYENEQRRFDGFSENQLETFEEI